jgi:hypothetical protein
MLAKKITRALAPLLLVATAAYGCASNDGTPTQTQVDNDDLTAEEAAEGAAWAASPTSEQGAHEDEAVPYDDGALTTPEEDSAPYLDKDDAADDLVDVDGAPLPALDETEIKAASKCKKATGYRSGSKFTICVMTINGKLVEVNTGRAYLRMRKAAAKKGIGLYVVSGFRTMAQQRYFYNCYKTKKCNGGNLAAPPGYSNHQSGHALDLNTSAHGVYWYLSKYGKNYRFKRTVPSEAWHWERW